MRHDNSGQVKCCNVCHKVREVEDDVYNRSYGKSIFIRFDDSRLRRKSVNYPIDTLSAMTTMRLETTDIPLHCTRV